MEYDKDFDETTSQALLEVERDLSLPSNSLVNGTPSQFFCASMHTFEHKCFFEYLILVFTDSVT